MRYQIANNLKNEASKSGLVIAAMLVMLIAFAGPAYSQSQPLTVTTDRTSYASGDTFIITGTTATTVPTDQDSNTSLVIQVMDPENNVVSTKLLEPDDDGRYTAELTTEGFEISGIYLVHVTYADYDQEATFEFKGPDSEPPKENLVVAFSDGTSRSVDARMNNGIITRIIAVEESATLVFSLTTGSEAGTLEVVLPRDVIDSKYEPDEMDVEGEVIEEENSFLVLVDGDYATYDETSTTPTLRTLKISIPAGTEEVMIGGTSMIPEFPYPIFAALISIGSMVTYFRVKKKLNR